MSKAVERTLDAGLALIAESDAPSAYDAYKLEREARQKVSRGEALDAETQKARDGIWSEVNAVVANREAATREALEAAEGAGKPSDYDEVQEQIRYAEIAGRATAMDLHKERESAGFLDRCNETAATYGQFAPDVAQLMMASAFYTQLVEECLDFPENIGELNSLPLEQVKLRIARAEGIFSARGEQRQARPAPKQVSSAPKPVSTVSGRSHAHSLTPDEMDYSTYKAWRMKQINGGRR